VNHASSLPPPAELRPSRLPMPPSADINLADELVRLAREGYPTARPDCDECSNTGRVVEGVYGGKVCFVSGCPECGRGET
jgi:hypothetical protein